MSNEIKLEIRVDTTGFLANNLRGYEPTSILREQLQNADDACHVQELHGATLTLQFLDDRLRVTNPSVFHTEDWNRIMTPNSRGKFGDEEQTGEFGIGFWGCLHLTDLPVIISGDRRVEMDISGPRETRQKTFGGTVFEFPYRRQQTDLAKKLDALPVTYDIEAEMAETFVNQLADLLLFTRAVDCIQLGLPDGSTRTARRATEHITDHVQRLTVDVDGDDSKNSTYLVVRGQVPDPPEGRHDRVSVALPLSPSHFGLGRAFFTFPTETSTGLNLSIDAHYRATDDRRSLESSGAHGVWNDAIFVAAGEAVGANLETIIDPAIHGLAYEQALTWFAELPNNMPDVQSRATHFSTALDQAARTAQVVMDTTNALRRPEDLVALPEEVADLLTDWVDLDVAAPLHDANAAQVLWRWGLITWGPSEVATWLANTMPRATFARTKGPDLLRSTDDVLRLLHYCAGFPAALHGIALAHGTDDQYHPIGGDLHRRSSELEVLATGLASPLLNREFETTIAGSAAPVADATWLHTAVRATASRLAGRKVPVKSIGVARSQTNLVRALQLFIDHALSLDAVPLAIDETLELANFDDQTVSSLPATHRQAAEALARRVGLRPLHKSLDELVIAETHTFGLSLVLDELPSCSDWDPVADSRVLLDVLAALRADGWTIDPAHVERIRELAIWKASDGNAHPLTELCLPARDQVVKSSRLLLCEDLFDAVDPGDPVYATLHSWLDVQILDTTEEAVSSCETPPRGRTARLDLLRGLADCAALTAQQVDRLRHAAFVLCHDGTLRRPEDALLCTDELPLSLNGARVDLDVINDRKVRERLQGLKTPNLPSASQLIEAAEEVALAPLEPGGSGPLDPGRVLWDFLLEHSADYETEAINRLGDIAWLAANPGPKRAMPSHCLDPALSFAELLYPVIAGVGTPPRQLRDQLRIRATLEDDDLLTLAHRSATEGIALSKPFFVRLNDLAGRDPASEAKVGSLRSVAFIPLREHGFAQPDEMVSREQFEVWGHRRKLTPELLSEFPALLTSWGIGEDAEVTWRDHLDVLKEIGRIADRDTPSLDEIDDRLARQRFRSLAELITDPDDLKTIRREGWIPTSLGLVRCKDSYEGDFPVHIVDRLKAYLPVVNVDQEIAEFIKALELTSLRAAVHLEPIVNDEQPDRNWHSTFTVQAGNILRFLRHAGLDVDSDFRDAWPPMVRRVSSLLLSASVDGIPLDSWVDQAYLGRDEGCSVLYVRGATTEVRDIVDAFDSAFGIGAGMKSLLKDILTSDSADSGAQALDWNGIPRLKVDEEYVPPHEERPDIHIPEGSGEGYSLTTTPNGDTDTSADQTPTPTPQEVEDRRCDSGATDSYAKEDAASDGDDPVASADGQQNGIPKEAARNRTRSPRGVTDLKEVEALGVTFAYELDEESEDETYDVCTPLDEAQTDKVGTVLSFYDVAEGLIPVKEGDLNWLSSNSTLASVYIFGQIVIASKDGPHHIRLDGGANLYHQRHVVPGTVMWLYPSVPGRIEVELIAAKHSIDGVWMLELADDGSLTRLELQDVELTWETDDGFYRAERRLEDIRALMVDGGKSALQLLIEVYTLHPGEGFTIDELWGIVAVSRLFAKSTISRRLSEQRRLFSLLDGRWYKTGSVWLRKRKARSPSSTSGSTRSDRTQAVNRFQAAHKLASQLAAHLVELDPAEIRVIDGLLGLSLLLHDQEFADSCLDYVGYLGGENRELFAAIERDIVADPARVGVLLDVLSGLSTEQLSTHPELVDLLSRHGSAGTVLRANALRKRITSVLDGTSLDPETRARELLASGSVDADTLPLVWEALEQVWNVRIGSDPLEEPAEWADALGRWESLQRAAARLGDPPETEAAARQRAIGWVNGALPAEVYDKVEQQGLRVLVDLLLVEEDETVIDGLHQLALLYEQTPSATIEALTHHRLVQAHAGLTRVTGPIVNRSRRIADQLASGGAIAAMNPFIDHWCDLTRLPRSSILRSSE